LPGREYSQAFLDAADDYQLDWRLLPSISFVNRLAARLRRTTTSLAGTTT